MKIRDPGSYILARGNYPQDVIGDLVVWDLVVLLVITFNIASSSYTVRSEKGV